jgi:hypothetical protein
MHRKALCVLALRNISCSYEKGLPKERPNAFTSSPMSGPSSHPNAGQKVLTPSRYLKASYLRASYLRASYLQASYLQASYLQASALVSFQALIYVYGAGRQEVLGSPGRSQ